MRAEKPFLIFLLSLVPVHLGALERRVVIETAPFVPCTTCDLVTYNQSLLNRQLTGVGEGETVNILAWEKGDMNVLVDLADGSRGYMPAFAFIKGGVSIQVPERAYLACPHYDLSTMKGPIKYMNHLPAGTYLICDAGYWSCEKRGLQCGFMVVKPAMKNARYFVSNAPGEESYARIGFKSHCDAAMQALPYETRQSGTLFYERYGRNSVESYKGVSEEDLRSVLGEPDAWIAAPRSKKGHRELFYRNVCYDDPLQKDTYNLGAVFYVDGTGTVVEGSRDAFLSVPKKGTRCLDLPGRDSGGGIEAGRSEHKVTAMESSDAFNQKVGDWFGRGIGKLLKLLLLAVLLCYIENVKFRVNAKVGGNRTALCTSAIIPGVIMLYFFIVTTGPSGLMNIITFLLIAAVIYFALGWNRDFVEKNRCAMCHKLVSPKKYTVIEKGHPYTVHSYTRAELDTHYETDVEDLGDGFDRVTDTKTTDFEDRKYTTVLQDLTIRKDCPRCRHSWTYRDKISLGTKMEVTDRFSTTSSKSYVKTLIRNPETEEIVTVWKTGENELTDGNGNVYKKYQDGFYHLNGKRYW